VQEKPRTRSQTGLLRPVAFRPHLTMGLALSRIANDFVRLPSGRSPREAKVRHLEVGPLHSSLRKWCPDFFFDIPLRRLHLHGSHRLASDPDALL
jgi:hypothetical protein